MIPFKFSCGTGFIDIGLREADAEAVKRGACEVAQSMVPRRGSYLDPRHEPLFRYYFKVDGTEIGYFNHYLNQLHFHDQPRVWDAGFRAGLVKDQFRNLCPGPIPPDDGGLALGTKERKDQERYFEKNDAVEFTDEEKSDMYWESNTAEGIAPDDDTPIFLKKQAD